MLRVPHLPETIGKGTRARALLWAVLFALIVGVLNAGEPLDKFLRVARAEAHPHAASGEVVVVAFDRATTQAIGPLPVPRRHYADIIEKLNQLGARKIAFDIMLSNYESSSADDRRLREALQRSRAPVVLPTLHEDAGEEGVDVLPAAELLNAADGTVSISVWTDYARAVWEVPFAMQVAGSDRPSLATFLAGRKDSRRGTFPVDYSLDPKSVPTVSVADLLAGKVAPSRISGKAVVIGDTNLLSTDRYSLPGHGVGPGVMIHVFAAETLIRGPSVSLGWAPPLLLALFVVGLTWHLQRRAARIATLMLAMPGILGVALALERDLYFMDVVPALALIVFYAGAQARSRHSEAVRESTTNQLSGLPNLNGLRQAEGHATDVLVVARIHNYPKVMAALPNDAEGELARQVAHRLAVGSPSTPIHQGDEGLFAWFETAFHERTLLEDRLDGLHSLLRSPVSVSGLPVDLIITFGVDRRRDRSLPNRIGSALLAADEAYDANRRWAEFDEEKAGAAEWEVSLLGSMEEALEVGEIWVAFQPKLDIRSGRIAGAEALVRWTHPERGEIPPMDFVPLAEQHNRIDVLTFYVLHEAVRLAAEINRGGVSFGMAVNLSARMLEREDVVERITALLDRYFLAPSCLTIEITETSALQVNGDAVATLRRMRDLGLNVSIDDYGTGFSTLEYLRLLPATELKIDKSFVVAIDQSVKERLVVHSTIQLAHSLGQRVIAEGVERPEVLQVLRELGCDGAQGYLVGEPMPAESLERVLGQNRSRRRA